MTFRRLVSYDFEQGNLSDTSLHLAPQGHISRQSFRMCRWVNYSPGLWVRFGELKPGDSAWLRVTGWIWYSGNPQERKCYLVTTCNHKGVNFKYMFIDLEKENLGVGKWNRISFDYRIPRPTGPEDVLQAYFWYRGKEDLLVDDFECKVYLKNR